MLQFEEEGHVYQWDGKVVPSVTQIIEPLSLYAGIPQDILDNAARRGQYVHKLCELDMAGMLDEDDVDEANAGYLTAWRTFMGTAGFEPYLNEIRMYHEKLGYAGTPDLVMLKKGKPALIDIKCTSSFIPTVGPQTAAYSELLHACHGIQPWRRYCLRLMNNGMFELKALENQSDIATFRSCLNIWRWRNDYGE